MKQYQTTMHRKLEFINQIIHSQHLYADNSGLVLELRSKLERLPLGTLSQLATIVEVAASGAIPLPPLPVVDTGHPSGGTTDRDCETDV